MDPIDAIEFAVLFLHTNKICQCDTCQRLRPSALAGLIQARAIYQAVERVKVENHKLREHIRDLEGWVDGVSSRGMYS